MKKKLFKILSSTLIITGSLGFASCAKLNSFINPPDTTTSDKEEPVKKIQIAIHVGDNVENVIIEGDKTVDINNYLRISDDYVFRGWYYDALYGEPVEEEIINSSSEHFTFYAKLDKAERVSLTLNIQGEDTVMSVPKNSSFNLLDYTDEIEGYKFNGWYADKNYRNKIDDNTYKITRDTILYAKYDKINYYTVRVHLKGEVIESKYSSETTISINDFVTPSDNEILTGWYGNADYSFKYPNEIKVGSALELYIEIYNRENVNYTVYGAQKEELANTSVLINSYINLTSYEKNIEHYTFEGWYYDENFERKIETPSRVKLSSNTSFYAKYQENKSLNLNVFYYYQGYTKEINIGKYYFEEIVDLEDYKIQDGFEIEELYYDSNLMTPLQMRPYRVEELAASFPDGKIYSKMKANLDVYVNNSLVHTESNPLYLTYNKEDYIKYCGEDYKFEGFTNKDEANLQVLIGNSRIDLDGFSYLNFNLYDSFEYKTENGKITITKYTGNNPIVQIPTIIENKQVAKLSGEVFDDKVVKVIIPQTVTSFDSRAFANCKKLVEVYNLSSVSINADKNNGPYYVYKSLQEESKIKTYNNEYLIYEDGAETYLISYIGVKPKLTIPRFINDKEYKIYKYAFTSNKYINTLIIPEGIKEIPAYALANMTNLVQIRIPKTLKDIGVLAFEDCHKLLEVYNDSSLDIKLNSIDYGGITNYAYKVFNNKEEFDTNFRVSYEDVLINNELENVGYLVYEEENKQKYLLGISYSNTDVNEVVLPSTLESGSYKIIHHAFSSSNVKNLIIPKGVEEIGDNAFDNSSNLISLEFDSPECLSIGSYAFANCYRLANINIPSCVENIGSYAFANCTNAIYITFEASSDNSKGLKEIGNSAFSNCSTVTNLVIPKTTQKIGERAFQSMNALESITLPFIGETRDSKDNFYFGYVFGGASTISGTINVGIPSNIKTLTITDDEAIESQAFWKVTTLSNIIFERTKKLGVCTFGYCTALESIAFTSNQFFEQIESDSFYGATRLNTFKTDKILDFYNSSVMMSLYGKGKSLQTTSELQKVEVTTGKTTAIVSTALLNPEDIITNFNLVFDDFNIDKATLLQIMAKEKEIGNENNFKFEYDSKPKTKNVDGILYYDDKAQVYNVYVDVTFNKKLYIGTSSDVNVVEQSGEN